MEILVETSGWDAADAALIREAVGHTLAAEGREGTEISVTLLDDDAIRALNLRYLGHDRPTDVIAFALGEDADLVGDVYLGFEQAERQAGEHGVPLEHELARLAIHGTLHVLGHDHPEGPERWESPMYRVQERLLSEVLEGGAP